MQGNTGPSPTPREHRCLEPTLEAARAAQSRWAAKSLDERLRVIGKARELIAERASKLCQSVSPEGRRQPGETLVVELLPLADACRYLVKAAPQILASRRLGHRGRPFWLYGIEAEIHREPLGVVLILGPFNYPLFLPGIHCIQALTAGNAAIVKPAKACEAPMRALAEILKEAGLPDGLLAVLDDSTETGEAAVASAVDKVVLTGSAETGGSVLAGLAPRLIPATVEASGSDAVFVLPGADLAMVADALAYGLRLNGGATCIAPRRVFVVEGLAPALEKAVERRLSNSMPIPLTPARRAQLSRLFDEAEAAGCGFIPNKPDFSAGTIGPLAVTGATTALGLLKEDLMSPVLSIVAVADEETALAAAKECPYALGAAVFGPEPAAQRLAERVDAGSVTINDLIVPTADPRLPFGGRRLSGFGTTRGDQGLLEMTAIKTISRRRGTFRPHFDPPQPDDEEIFQSYIEAAHGAGLGRRFAATLRLVKALSSRRRGTASG